MSENLNTAFRLASNGFCVFPCYDRNVGDKQAKAPLGVRRWYDESTTDKDQIQKWWSRHPNAAVGLALGKSRLIVIDVDNHEGKANGVEAFDKLLVDNNADFEGVPVVNTPSNGSHYYFRMPENCEHGNGEGDLPDGINVRGSKGYVIAPGTLMADGSVYEEVGDIGLSPVMPKWLWDIISHKNTPTQKQYEPSSFEKNTTTNELSQLLNSISPDCGYEEWVSCLMAIHAETGGAPEGFAIIDKWSAQGQKYDGTKALKTKWKSFQSGGVNKGTLAEIARRHGADLSQIAIDNIPPTPPAKLAEYDRINKSLWDSFVKKDKEEKKKRHKEALIDISEDEYFGGATAQFDIPESMLNAQGLVGELTQWICDWTSEPIKLHALGAALVIVGTTLGRKVYTTTRPTSTALYIGVTAASGIGKQHNQDCIKLALDSLVSRPLHTGWGTTLASLAKTLGDCPLRAIIADEFAEKIMSINSKKASSSEARVSEVLRTLWGTTTGTYTPDLAASRDEQNIERPNVSLYGSTTSSAFSRALSSNDVTNGLFNRFLIFPRFGEVHTTDEPEGLMYLDDDLKRKLNWMFNCAGELMAADSQISIGAPKAPLLIPFTQEAKKMDINNKAFQKKMMLHSDKDDSLSLYGRYAEQIKRIALIIACGRRPEDVKSTSITFDDMKFAQNLVEYSINQFVLSVRQDMTENWIEANRNKVLRTIRGEDTIDRSKLLRKIRSISAREINDIIGILKEANQISQLEESTQGRAKIRYKYVQG